MIKYTGMVLTDSTLRCQCKSIGSNPIVCILFLLISTSICNSEVILKSPKYPQNKDFLRHLGYFDHHETFDFAYSCTKILNTSENRRYYRMYLNSNESKYDNKIKPWEYIPTYPENFSHYYALDDMFYRFELTCKHVLSGKNFRTSIVKKDEDIYNSFFNNARFYRTHLIFDEAFAITNGCIILKRQGLDYSIYKQDLDIVIDYCDQMEQLLLKNKAVSQISPIIRVIKKRASKL